MSNHQRLTGPDFLAQYGRPARREEPEKADETYHYERQAPSRMATQKPTAKRSDSQPGYQSGGTSQDETDHQTRRTSTTVESLRPARRPAM